MKLPRQLTVTPSELRAEGVFEVGRAPGTGFLFVVTEERVLLFHVGSLPDRRLDDYAIELALSWIEWQGVSAAAVAGYLGVSQETLRNALVQAGHQRHSAAQLEHYAHARMSRKFGPRTTGVRR
jgi:hypothetical protein